MAITGRLYALARQEQDIMQDAQFRSMLQESKDTGAVIIDGRNIAAGSIYSHQLHAESVTADKIQAGAITGDHIEANTIGVDKLVASDLLLPGESYGGVRITQDGLTMDSTGNAGVSISLSSETGLNITDKYDNPLIDIDPATGQVTMQVDKLTIGGYDARTEEDAPIEVVISSTNGNMFRNGKGQTYLTALVYQHGEELDPYRTDGQQDYQYFWRKYENNQLDHSFGGNGVETGKRILVDDGDVNGLAVFDLTVKS